MAISMKYKCPFKQNQIVIFDLHGDARYENAYPFKTGERVLFLGEVVKMPGHCIVVNKRGQTLWGYHTDNFREPTEDEL